MTPTKTHYPNGRLECEGFVNGKIQVGSWTFYHENGNLFSKGQYDDNGNPIGEWTEYFDNGKIKYKAISPQGNCFSLSSDNLEILNDWTEDGRKLINNGFGKITTYYDNGTIKHNSHRADNLKNGFLQEFYENGQVKVESRYKNGMKDGAGKVFYENGNLCSEQCYQNGKHIGQYREWYENGKLAEEGDYINGDYVVINFWTEEGRQVLKDGSGKAIRKFGATGDDNYEQHFDKGKMTNEKKIADVTYGRFTPGTNETNGL